VGPPLGNVLPFGREEVFPRLGAGGVLVDLLPGALEFVQVADDLIKEVLQLACAIRGRICQEGFVYFVLKTFEGLAFVERIEFAESVWVFPWSRDDVLDDGFYVNLGLMGWAGIWLAHVFLNFLRAHLPAGVSPVVCNPACGLRDFWLNTHRRSVSWLVLVY
jgi:hypothetical protein